MHSQELFLPLFFDKIALAKDKVFLHCAEEEKKSSSFAKDFKKKHLKMTSLIVKWYLLTKKQKNKDEEKYIKVNVGICCDGFHQIRIEELLPPVSKIEWINN